jgi:2-polyprenyl-6-hydroxyphenyl methylase/3-demethylubiquinone-9 3-methyltransferase
MKDEMSTPDDTSHEKFYDHYAKASQGKESLQRFRSIRDCVLRVIGERNSAAQCLEVVDIGCGAGTGSMMWAELGHHVHGLDVNRPLLELAKERAASAGYIIDFRSGSALDLPWSDGSMDVCIVLELLEHVADWKKCLSECARILRPGGVLFLTTTNKLCPIQEEFNLPLYSWYPAPLKHYFENLAVTKRQDLANYAKYPAVNWFSFYRLRAVLAAQGFQCLDRFDITDVSDKSPLKRLIVYSVRAISLLRFLAHVASPGTIVVAIKGRSTAI